MARLNVYVPDELAARAREAGLNVSSLTQQAISHELAKDRTSHWLASIPVGPGVAHDRVMEALDGAREEFGA